MLILFKAFLILSLAILGYFFFFRLHRPVFQRLLGLALGSVLLLFVLVSDWSTDVARLFGIGRGVDFVFYLSHVLLGFIALRFYLSLHQLRRDVDALVSDLAVRSARPPG